MLILKEIHQIGALVDLGIYPLAVIIALWGKPCRILATAIKLSTGVDGSGDILLSYDEEGLTKQATISYSKITQGSNISEFQGELGRIEIQGISQLKHIELVLNDGTREVISLPFESDFMKYEIKNFISLTKNLNLAIQTKSQLFSQELLEVIQDVRQQLGIVYPSDVES